MKTFTLDEANALLPVLETRLRTALASHGRVEEYKRELAELAHQVFLAGGTLVNISERIDRRKQADREMQRLNDVHAEIEAMGVQLKDLQIGLLDFPCRLQDDEIILLCWKLGEPSIGFWHTLDSGYRGRRPIDGRIPRQHKAN